MKRTLGYTLVEVSITLAALFILSVFCITAVLRSPGQVVIDGLRNLQTELICLQHQSMACNLPCRIIFLPEQNAYQIIQIEKNTLYKLPKNVVFGFKEGIKGPPGKPERVINTAIRFENPHPLAAIIQPHGRISSGTIYLKHTSGSAMGAITITPHQIAHVRVYVLADGLWKILGS